MKNYRNKIVQFETENEEKNIVERIGKYPILITSVHSMKQIKKDGTTKLPEPFTKSLVKYVAEETNIFYLIKTKDSSETFCEYAVLR